MEEIKKEIKSVLEGNPERIIVSNKQDKNYQYRKVEIKPVVVKKRKKYQVSMYTDKQVFQNNINIEEIEKEICVLFPEHFKQLNVFKGDREVSLKTSKAGKLLKHTKRVKVDEAAKTIKYSNGEHNRTKNYIIKEGDIVPPLVDMGIFTKEGKIVKAMYDKFKQINRFVEMIDDVLKDYKRDEINIIDFGCGKSYLTFIIYYYLVEIKNKKANIIGLDLKADVIAKCNQAAQKYGYSGLKFELGDINGYTSEKPVDMVVTLHACDVATDFALYNAVKWNATYILSVPCCQHEVNKTISSDALHPMMKYGIIKERTAALMTDALRGTMLEYRGYKTQLLEFVDLAHSPKNILIRAVKSNISKEKKEKAYEEARNMCEFFNVEPTIYRMLGE